MICNKWKARVAVLENENNFLREAVTEALKDVDYFRDRMEKATDALLALQQKPALTKPDEKATEAFLTNHLSMFRDEDGLEDAA